MHDFNSIASFYDLLKKIVFQSSLDKASFLFLKEIPECSQILIIGGGSGEILPLLKKSQKVTFIEKSSAMIELASQRNFVCAVEFIEADIIECKFQLKYDAVITPFILDCFNEDLLSDLFSKLNNQLKHKGLWLHTDFYPQHILHKLFVRIMYAFFKISVGLRVSSIPDFDKLFGNSDLQLVKKVSFRHGFIQSRLYQKID